MDAVIIDAVRSPIGRGSPGGSLSALRPVDLLAQTLCGLMNRVNIDPAEVDEIVTGWVECGCGGSSTIGRAAWLAAGLPMDIASAVVRSGDDSSHRAMHFAADRLVAGLCGVVVVGGIGSVSCAAGGATPLGGRHRRPSIRDDYAREVDSQIVAAVLMAQRWGIKREVMDAYAERSQRCASAVSSAGEFRREIVAIKVPSTNFARVEYDEMPDPFMSGTAPETTCRPLADTTGRVCCPDEVVTVGNSSQPADAAAGMLIMTQQRADELNLLPRARLCSLATCSDGPHPVLPGPVTATNLALSRAGITIDELDHVEVDETFAVGPLAWQGAIGVRQDFLNPRGGAIALGHPRGASGVRLMATMLSALEDTGGRFGLQVTWEPGGTSTAAVIERL